MVALVEAVRSSFAGIGNSGWYASAHEYAYNVLSIQADKGFWVVYGQVFLFFYGAVFMIDAVIPTFVTVRSVQKGQPYPGQFWVNLLIANRACPGRGVGGGGGEAGGGRGRGRGGAAA